MAKTSKKGPGKIDTGNDSDRTGTDADADRTGDDDDADVTRIKKEKTRFSKKHKETDPDTTGIDTGADKTKKESKNKTKK